MTLNPTTRASLLLRIRDPKDHEAWVDFVSLYEPAIYRILRRAGLQEADAVELMQEFLLTVSRNIDRWETNPDRGSFRGWLQRVVRNLVVSWVRKSKRQVTVCALELDKLLDSHPADNSPETEAFDVEVRRALFHKAAEQVRTEVHTQTWQAFWNVAVSGRSVSETATTLGMSVGAVRVAKSRVIAKLRDFVTRWESSS